MPKRKRHGSAKKHKAMEEDFDDDNFDEFIRPEPRKAAKMTTQAETDDFDQELQLAKTLPRLPNEIIDQIIFYVLDNKGKAVRMKKRRIQPSRNTTAKDSYGTVATVHEFSYTKILLVSRSFHQAGLQAFFATTRLWFPSSAMLAEFVKDISDNRRKHVRQVTVDSGRFGMYSTSTTPPPAPFWSVAPGAERRFTNKAPQDMRLLMRGFPKLNRFVFSKSWLDFEEVRAMEGSQNTKRLQLDIRGKSYEIPVTHVNSCRLFGSVE